MLRVGVELGMVKGFGLIKSGSVSVCVFYKKWGLIKKMCGSDFGRD